MGRCLKPSEVRAFLAGSLSAEDKARIETHVSSCSQCHAVLEAAGRDGSAPGAPLIDPGETSATLTMASTDGQKPGVADLIEGYEILHEIHRGGQGIVYKAVQLATKRTVALKLLLHEQFATSRQIHRFEREIDLVASIQHPNIVTVYDSGLTSGRYYFAMEYIHGKPLDDYLAACGLDLAGKLRLFRTICLAVNAAHQRGVLHRDLKPGNIRIDADGEPHVLDFGLAKAAGSQIQDGEPVTVSGEFMGTPAYASPEHAHGDPRLIDTRADVYSLGVILYEMLTGDYPYPVVGPVSEVLEHISRTDARKPSELECGIDGELETIVLMALAKEKERRYQSALALARDIERYLAGEPLDARRDSTWYVLRKSLRRYRLAVGMTAAIVAVLAVATIALSVMYQAQSRARLEVETARNELEIVTAFQRSMLSDIDAEEMGQALYGDLRRRLADALAAEGRPAGEREVALSHLDDLLGYTNATDVALALLDEQVLARAARTIETDFADQPVIRATLQQTIADTYGWIGRYTPALPLQESALETRRAVLGDDHEATLSSLHSMGNLLVSMGRFDEARDLLAEALAGRRRVLGDEHADTLVSLNSMATLLESMGRFDEALQYYQDALVGKRRLFGDDHASTLAVINNLANLLHQMGQGQESLRYHSEGLEIRRRIQGNDHPETLVSMANLGGLLMSMGKLEPALGYLSEALAGNRRVLGDVHPYTLITINYMGALLKRMGRLEEAEPYYLEALAGNRRVLGDDHINTVTVVHNLGNLLRDLGRLAEAEVHGKRAVAWARESLPTPHPHTAEFLRGYGVTLVRCGRHGEAEAALLEAQSMLAEAVGETHPRTIEFTREIAALYEAWHAAEPGAGHDARAARWRARADGG